MQIMTVGEFKANFSKVLSQILAGKSIGISYGKKKKVVATINPYKKKNNKGIKLGYLEGKATFRIKRGWDMTDEEFLAS